MRMNKTVRSHGVVCERCGAEIGVACKTAGGSIRRSRPHKIRKQAWEVYKQQLMENE